MGGGGVRALDLHCLFGGFRRFNDESLHDVRFVYILLHYLCVSQKFMIFHSDNGSVVGGGVFQRTNRRRAV